MAEFLELHNGKVKILRGKRGGHGFGRDPEAREDRLNRDNLRRRADDALLREQLELVGAVDGFPGDDSRIFCGFSGDMVPANGAVTEETRDGRSLVTIVYKDGVAASACCRQIRAC